MKMETLPEKLDLSCQLDCQKTTGSNIITSLKVTNSNVPDLTKLG